MRNFLKRKSFTCLIILLILSMLALLMRDYSYVKMNLHPPLVILNKNPEKYKGKIVKFGYLIIDKIIDRRIIKTKINGIPCELYLIDQKIADVNLVKNNIISMKAIYLEKSKFKILEYTVHKNRKWKKIWSVLGLLALFFYLIYIWREKFILKRGYSESSSR